jgi:hypothetical protein
LMHLKIFAFVRTGDLILKWHAAHLFKVFHFSKIILLYLGIVRLHSLVFFMMQN